VKMSLFIKESVLSSVRGEGGPGTGGNSKEKKIEALFRNVQLVSRGGKQAS